MESENSLYLEKNFPAVIKGKINDWAAVNYTKNDWCNIFKNKVLKFREGKKAFTRTPYWENLCDSKEITLNEFFQLSTQNQSTWLYYDYKYLRDVFPDNESFINGIKWSDLKLFDLDSKESALWIGNEGAHTPCHKDTYGCNFVAQIFGRKLWILLPPEESDNIGAVRVPYEESSVYSGYNFFTPNNNLLNIKKAYKIILSPGDVLYVPRHWWHYVENLESAISVNIWVPLIEDHESRLEECLIQHYVSAICQDLTEEESKQILNPNENYLLKEPCTLDAIEKCLKNYEKYKKSRDDVWEKIKNVKCDSNKMEDLNIKSYIEEKCKIYNYDPNVKKETQNEISFRVSLARNLINAYCHPNNIISIKNSLLKR